MKLNEIYDICRDIENDVVSHPDNSELRDAVSRLASCVKELARKMKADFDDRKDI